MSNHQGPSAEHLEILADLAAVSPDLGLNGAELRERAEAAHRAEYERDNPYVYSIWRFHHQIEVRCPTIGDAVDSWAADASSDGCAMADTGIMRDGRELLDTLVLWTLVP